MAAQGGSKIRNARLGAEGTLACLVQSRSAPARRYLLSAAHVLCPSGFGARGDSIEADLGAGQWQAVATLADWTRLSPIPGAQQSYDAAIAEITNPGLVSADIGGIGHPPTGLAGFIYPGMAVQVSGAFSGRLMSGSVHSIDRDVSLVYEDPFDQHEFTMDFKGQTLYGQQGSPWQPITQAGDSGALVLDAFGQGLGLHIAATAASFGVTASVFSPLRDVLDQLDVDLVTSPGTVPAGAPDPETLNAQGDTQFGIKILPLLALHQCFDGSVKWQLTPQGLRVDGVLDRTRGEPVTVARVWRDFGTDICDWAARYRVPAELIVATICTESNGDRNVPSRPESKGRLSAGLMQTLIGTAQQMLDSGVTVDEAWLRIPRNGIQAGTACIAGWRGRSAYDPPLVACVYNAGGIYQNDGTLNRWKLKQYPIGTGQHVDRFVQWFNDCFAHLEATAGTPLATGTPSFWQLLR